MIKAKYLHVFNNETKFSKGFFDFLLDNHFDLNKHELFHYGKADPSYKKYPMGVTFAKYYSMIKHFKLLRSMFRVEKIIIHSLASPWLLWFLFLFPKLTKKVYWVIWGKDLYFYKLLEKKHIHHHLYEFFRKRVFKKIKHVVTYVPGDAELAKQWYQVDANYHECLMYPSNLFKAHQFDKEKNNQVITIQAGNSADPSNHHEEIFDKLLPYKEMDIKIIAPLSYGDASYAKRIIKLGTDCFGDKFIPLTSFIPIDEYIKMINQIDIAVFAHNRQQAMGNIITLLGMGKHVYLKSDITSYQLFKKLDIEVYDFSSKITLNQSIACCQTNKQKVARHFSQTNLKQQWNTIFYEN